MYISKTDKIALGFLLSILTTLIEAKDKYQFSLENVIALRKALHVASSYPSITIKGSIEISAFEKAPNGSFSIDCFVVAFDSFEIFSGSYENNGTNGLRGSSKYVYPPDENDKNKREFNYRPLEIWRDSFWGKFKGSAQNIDIVDEAELL